MGWCVGGDIFALDELIVDDDRRYFCDGKNHSTTKLCTTSIFSHPFYFSSLPFPNCTFALPTYPLS